MVHQVNFAQGRGGIEIRAADIVYIRNFVKSYPKLPRTEVICTLCEHLQWVTPGGRPKYDASTKLLAQLEQSGEISLPPLKESHSHKGQQKPRAPLEVVTPGDPVECTLAELGAVRLRVLSEVHDELQCNAAIESFHPLGYKKPFGYVMRYCIEADGLGLGYLLFSGAAKKIHHRDEWIGWNERQRCRNVPWVVNNSRFLIFPWVKVSHLASHVLGRLARQLAEDWQARWGFAPLLLESFVDPQHYRGTCYRAAGWTLLGHTSGRGLARPGMDYCSSPKLIFVKPLQSQFRQLLCSDQLSERESYE